jgi:hypothetical protein
LVASALHEKSKRNKRPFVVFDCSAVAENLIESELFGHEKGSFTGSTEGAARFFHEIQGFEGSRYMVECLIPKSKTWRFNPRPVPTNMKWIWDYER